MFMRKSISKIVLIAALATATLPLNTMRAAAQPTDTNVEFKAGKLEFPEGAMITTIEFGLQDVPKEQKTYNATTVTGNIVVSDARGSGAGWNVKAQLSDFTYNQGASKTLTGSYITFSAITPTTDAGNNNVANPAPESKNAKLFAGGNAENVLVAAEASGRGVWTSTWANDDIALTVMPGDIVAGEAISATITWTLASTPE